MSSAAEFDGEFTPHAHYANLIAVFFAKQRHRTTLLRSFQRHDLFRHGSIRENLCVNAGFYLRYLIY